MIQNAIEEPNEVPSFLATKYYNDPHYSEERVTIGSLKREQRSNSSVTGSQINAQQLNNQPGARSGIFFILIVQV